MNYRGKKIAITGHRGFIGHALVTELANVMGAQLQGYDQENQHSLWREIDILDGDIRDRKTFSRLDHTYDYLFHFAAPSSQVLFDRNPQHCADVTLKGFINAAEACRRTGTKLIYPSTGLLSQNRVNEYALCKRICEDYVKACGIDAIGIRIFATFGPGEGRKRDYASVPYLFARDLINGKAPVVFGDGGQKRDFIYIDDVVQSILHIAEEANEPIVDVGSSEPISFKDIIDIIRGNMAQASQDPVFIPKPKNYVTETLADPTVLKKYYTPQISTGEGIFKLVRHLERRK